MDRIDLDRPEGSPLILGDWVLDPVRHRLSRQGQELKLEKRLVRVLLALAQSPRQTCSKQQLLDAAWPGKVVSDDTLSVAISQLRKILGCDPKQPSYIETISGYGFQLLPQVRVAAFDKPAPDPGSGSWPRGWLLPLLGLTLTLAVILWMALRPPLQPADSAAVHALQDNDVYLRARYLLQKNNLADLHQAEVLLKGLLEQYPDQLVLRRDYGKALLQQAFFVPRAARERLYHGAKQEFERLLVQAPGDAEAHLHLGSLAIRYDRQLTLAQAHFIRSIALNPGDIAAHLRYAELLLALGDFEQALHHNRIARSLDPQHYASASIAWVYNMAGHYEEAKKELAKLYSLEPDSLLYHSSALRLYENRGDEAAAFEHYLLAFERAGFRSLELDEARAMFAQGGLRQLNYWLGAMKNEQRDVGQYQPPVATARYLVAAGEVDAALDYLEQAYAEDDYLLLWLATDPKYRPLKGQPRFTRLLQQLGLDAPDSTNLQ